MTIELSAGEVFFYDTYDKDVFMMDLRGLEEDTLEEKVFSEEIVEEIKDEYTKEFGPMNFEGDWKSGPLGVEYFNGMWVISQERALRERNFGEYITRKLSEHHASAYLKSRASFKKVYVFKERVSRLSVPLKDKYTLKLKYLYSGNYLRAQINNPYKIRNQLILQMDRKSWNPIVMEDIIFHLGYPIFKQVTLDSRYRVRQKSLKVIGQYKISPSLRFFMFGVYGFINDSDFFKELDLHKFLDYNGDFEKQIFLGVSWFN